MPRSRSRLDLSYTWPRARESPTDAIWVVIGLLLVVMAVFVGPGW